MDTDKFKKKLEEQDKKIEEQKMDADNYKKKIEEQNTKLEEQNKKLEKLKKIEEQIKIQQKKITPILRINRNRREECPKGELLLEWNEIKIRQKMITMNKQKMMLGKHDSNHLKYN